MKHQLQNLFVAALAVLFGGCATTSVKHSWKSPDCQGRQLQKIAILAMDERDFVRQALERRFLLDLHAHGQAALEASELLAAPAIQADKDAAAARFRAEGADVILIIRLVDQTTYLSQVQASPQLGIPGVSGSDNWDWYDYFTGAFTASASSWSTSTQVLLLDSSLFDLKTKQRLWSALTETTVKEDA